LFDDVDQLAWNGPTPAFDALGARFDADNSGDASKTLDQIGNLMILAGRAWISFAKGLFHCS
jgi:hypothetical protein